MLKMQYYTRVNTRGERVNGEEVSISTRLILQAADELGVRWRNLEGTRIFELEYGGKKKYFRHQISSETTDVGFYATHDKSATNALLTNAGFRVPRGFRIAKSDSKEYWQEVFDALSKPVVVKPTHGNQGRAVSMNIKDIDTFSKAVAQAFTISVDSHAGVIAEETCEGEEFRILATQQKVIAVAKRVPANVIGDGISPITALIDKKNLDECRVVDPATKIKIDDELRRCLNDQGLTVEYVPALNQQVVMRYNSNISTGGDSIDVTDTIHESVKDIALRAVSAIPGLDFAGIDFMTKDITMEQSPDNYFIIEINTSPGFSIHEFPYRGKPRGAGKEFLYISFPELRT